MQTPRPSRFPVVPVVIAEWLMIVPATIFISAAILRLLQPSQYEPARTSWAIFNWTITHISSNGAAVLFMGLPALAIMLGCAMLARTWRDDEEFRADVKASLGFLRRYASVVFLAGGTALAGAILVFSVVHVIVG
jgi:hypothetical protein